MLAERPTCAFTQKLGFPEVILPGKIFFVFSSASLLDCCFFCDDGTKMIYYSAISSNVYAFVKELRRSQLLGSFFTYPALS